MRTFFALVCALALCTSCKASDAAYGEKLTFSKGQVLKFPDCELEFLGKSKVAVPVYPRGFTYYEFRVASGGKMETIKWSSGTGDIGPLSFEVGGRKFVLELSATKLARGFMKENELVLWRQRDFEKAVSR